MIERPVEADWLWERLFGLLRDFDLFMSWPAEELKTVVVRDEVPVLQELNAEKIVVQNAQELRGSIA
jgi:hypothetical protein